MEQVGKSLSAILRRDLSAGRFTHQQKNADVKDRAGSVTSPAQSGPLARPITGEPQTRPLAVAAAVDTRSAVPVPMIDVSRSIRRSGGSLELLFTSEESRRLFRDPIPKVLLCGLPRSGKTSIAKVVYFKTSPHETLYCDHTQTPEIHKIVNTRLVKFALIDAPGELFYDCRHDEHIFPLTASIVFVIDAQNDNYTAEISHCKSLFQRAYKLNPKVHLELFIHKVDGDLFAVDAVRSEAQREIHDKLMSHLSEELIDSNIVFYSTSIYDHTIFEACSRVVQRLVPQASTLEQLIDLLVANSRMEKAFLIDVISKTFIATDTSPFDPVDYELCTDMIDLLVEICCIYGTPSSSTASREISSSEAQSDPTTHFADETSCLIQLNNDQILYLKEVDKSVALACVFRGENFDRQHLVDYNIRIFRESMLMLFDET